MKKHLFLLMLAIQPAFAEEPPSTAPVMPPLFFTNEERRLLEIVRQEIISKEQLNFDEYVPLILQQNENTVTEKSKVQERGDDIKFNAYVRNNSNNKTVVWLNNHAYVLDSRDEILNKEKLIDGMSVGDGGALVGKDTVNNNNFKILVGQKINKQGDINETYPIITIKKR